MENAELKLVLDTKEALAKAKAFGPELQKALNSSADTKSLEQYLTLLNNILSTFKKIEKKKTLPAGIDKDQLAKDKAEIQSTARIVKDLIKERQELATLKAGPGVEGSLRNLASKKGGAKGDNKIAAEKAYDKAAQKAEKLQLKEETLTAKLQEHSDAVNTISDRYTDLTTKTNKTTENTEQAKAATKGLADNAEQAANSEKKAADEADRLAETQKKINSANTKSGNQQPEAQPVSGSTKRTLADIVKEIYTLRLAGQDASAVVTELQSRLNGFDVASANASRLKDRISEIGDALKYINNEADDKSKLDDAFNDLTKAAEPAKQALSWILREFKRLNAEGTPQNIDAFTTAFSIFQNKLQDVLASVTNVEQAMQFDGGKVGITELTKRLETLTRAQSFFDKNMLSQDATYKQYYDNILAQEEAVRQAISERKAEMSQTVFSGDNGQIIQSVTTGLDSVGSAFSNAGSYALNFSDILSIVRVAMGDVSAIAPLISSLFSKLTNAIKGTIDAIKNLINNMIKFTTSVANKFFSVMKNGLAGLSKAGNSIGGSDNPFDPKNIRRALQLLTKYVFGFRSFFFLYRRLRKLVGEGIENLVQFESETNETNKAITELKTSLLYIKNAWAAAFAPIINVVTPLLVTLMNAIADVGNAIARFVGALTGQEVVLNAVRVDAGDYAKSLDKAGGSAGRAADKTKKLTDRLAAFDDLNVLGIDRDPDATGSGGGGGGADSLEPDPNKMFKYVDAVSGFADMIKRAWAEQDFTEVGELIRDKLIEAITHPFGTDWNRIKDFAYKIGKSLITFLNGVFADPQLWVEAGNALGEGINTLGHFVAGLLQNNKVNWGLNFAEFIISSFRTFDPNLVLRNINDFVNLLIENINSFFARIFNERNANNNMFDKIEQLAGGLTGALIRLIEGIDWERLIKVALLIGKAILTGISNALSDSDNPMLKRLGGLIEDAIPVLLWAFRELSPVVSDLIGLFADVGLDFLQEAIRILPVVVKIIKEFATKWLPQIVDWLRQAWPIITWLAETGLVIILGLLEEFDFHDFVNALLTILQVVMALAGIWAIVTAPLIALPLILTNVALAIWRIADALDVKEWISAGTNLIDGFKNGIDEGLRNIYDWVKTHWFDPIVNTFKTLFGIHSPSTVFAEYGDDIIQGLLDGINARIEEVIQVFTDLKNSISEKWDDIKSATAQKWTEIGETIKSKVFDIKNNIVGEFSDVKDKIVQKFMEIVGGISEAFSSLKEAVKAPLNAAIDVIESFVNKVIKGINDLVKNFDGISEIASEVGLTVPELKIPTISIPRLAQGAVIPPNREFMAVLGDQSHGTNIEAPLDTIKQAVAEVIGTNAGNQEVIQLLQQLITVVESKELNIGDKEIAKANARYNSRQGMIRGASF